MFVVLCGSGLSLAFTAVTLLEMYPNRELEILIISQKNGFEIENANDNWCISSFRGIGSSSVAAVSALNQTTSSLMFIGAVRRVTGTKRFILQPSADQAEITLYNSSYYVRYLFAYLLSRPNVTVANQPDYITMSQTIANILKDSKFHSSLIFNFGYNKSIKPQAHIEWDGLRNIRLPHACKFLGSPGSNPPKIYIEPHFNSNVYHIELSESSKDLRSALQAAKLISNTIEHVSHSKLAARSRL